MEIEQVQQSGGGIVRPRGGFFLGKQSDVRQQTEQDVGHRCLGAFRFLFHREHSSLTTSYPYNLPFRCQAERGKTPALNVPRCLCIPERRWKATK